MTDRARIGLFVCECGDKIAGALDVPALVERAGGLPGVLWAGHTGYWCLPTGIELMQSTVAEQHLDRVVVAGCAPRTHDLLFRRALDGMLDPALINLTNLRDLCARPHREDNHSSMEKGDDQIAMAVADTAARQADAPRMTLIVPHAVVIGGGIAGMTAALAIGEACVPVTLVEREADLGGLARADPVSRLAKLVAERMAALRSCGNVRVMTNTRVNAVGGTVGRYQLTLSDGEVVEAGAIIVASGARSNVPPPHSPSARERPANFRDYAFILCDMSPAKMQGCSRTCCLAALERAAEIRRQSPDSEVTVFFRELYTAGGTFDDLVWQARQLGVGFVRYPAGRVPQAADGEIVTHNELTGREFRGSCDQLITYSPMTPQDDAADLAAMLRLPIDARGFMPEARLRLRPADRIERGIYVCGAAHYPCDTERAVLQAYEAAARAVRHVRQKEVLNRAPAVTIDAARCNGCGDCVRVCPFSALNLEARREDAAMGGYGDGETGGRGDGETGRHGDGERRRHRGSGVPVALVDGMLCTGCGNCVSVCPVKAAEVPSATDEQIEAQIRAALGGRRLRQANALPIPVSSPRVVIFACEWSGYSAAEIAGARQLSYPARARIIRINCTGRLEPGLLLKALEMGAAGVMVLGCAPGVCHYEQGNEHAAAVFKQANALARLMGLDKRLTMKWIPPDDGERFVQAVEGFIEGL